MSGFKHTPDTMSTLCSEPFIQYHISVMHQCVPWDTVRLYFGNFHKLTMPLWILAKMHSAIILNFVILMKLIVSEYVCCNGVKLS
jgi:hypothetical protein